MARAAGRATGIQQSACSSMLGQAMLTVKRAPDISVGADERIALLGNVLASLLVGPLSSAVIISTALLRARGAVAQPQTKAARTSQELVTWGDLRDLRVQQVDQVAIAMQHCAQQLHSDSTASLVRTSS